MHQRVRRVSLIQSHVIMTSICLMELEDCYISTPCTSLSMWKASVHQAGNPIRSIRQRVRHSHINLLGKPGSRIWVQIRKLKLFFPKHDWSLWRWQQAYALPRVGKTLSHSCQLQSTANNIIPNRQIRYIEFLSRDMRNFRRTYGFNMPYSI